MANALKYYQNALFHLERTRKSYKALMNTMNIPKTGQLKVIDIGVGSGKVFYEVLTPLLPRNVSEIVLCDISEEMIDFTRSINNDPRVTFEKLNIEGERVPKHLEKKFDLAFSAYCFSYIKDIRQAFKNSGKLLKSKGQLLNVFQYKTNGLYQTYRRMSAMKKWNSYMQDYANYKTLLTGSNPEEELKRIFKDIGMSLMKYEFYPEHYMDMTKNQVIEAYSGLDTKYLEIPKPQQEEYMEDFLRILGEETGIDFHDETTLDDTIQLRFPTVAVHAIN